MQKITPALLFGGNAEEALDYYESIFENSRVVDRSRYGDDAGEQAGTLLAATLELENQSFTLINGPDVKFTEAVSFMVSCSSQEEVDYYWDALTRNGGEESVCGWLNDRFGMAWQIVPERLMQLMADPDPGRASRTMQAMMKMSKIVIADLEAAADRSTTAEESV